MELALIILDFARYWPEITTESVAHRVIRDDDWSLEFSKTHLFLWELFPEEPGKHVKLKEIEFTIVSHDQGWTTENTTGKPVGHLWMNNVYHSGWSVSNGLSPCLMTGTH